MFIKLVPYFLIVFVLSVTHVENVFGAENSECLELYKKMHKDGSLPSLKIESIVEYVTWRASLCKIPPKGKGIVTALCDGQTSDEKTVFFWGKKYKNKIFSNHVICQPL